MKKRYLIILISAFILNGCLANAQIVKSFGMRMGWSCNFPGIREALNSNDIGANFHQRNSIYPELQVEAFPVGKFSLLINASYIRKGFSYSEIKGSGFSPVSTKSRVTENADYFVLSVLPKFQHNFRAVSLYGFAGPYIGLLKNYSPYYNKSISSTTNSGVTYETAMVLKPSVLGATVGAGIDLKHKDDAVYYSFQLQYMHDIGKAADFKKPVSVVGEPGTYSFQAVNKTLLVSLGIHFPFSK